MLGMGRVVTAHYPKGRKLVPDITLRVILDLKPVLGQIRAVTAHYPQEGHWFQLSDLQWLATTHSALSIFRTRQLQITQADKKTLMWASEENRKKILEFLEAVLILKAVLPQAVLLYFLAQFAESLLNHISNHPKAFAQPGFY